MFSDRRKRDMSNHGEGNKYTPVNLNKSYGYQPHHQYNQAGAYGANRGRGGGYGGGGGGGSMVVLSRPRSSQNAGLKLSVPPPLNLPSLRKEHERADSSCSSFHSGGGISGSGTRPASSGMGWSKPAVTAALQDGDVTNHTVEGVTRGSNGLNMHLASQAGSAEPLVRAYHPIEKVATLRGEDFPSLKASLPSASVSGQKQKEGQSQKQKQAAGEEYSKQPRGAFEIGSSLVDMRPQNQSGSSRLGNKLSESSSFPNGLHSSEQVSKKEYFPGPLPIVSLTPRSDWADDERDTSHGLRDRDRDNGYSKNDQYWDRGFDLPTSHVLPQKHAAPNLFDKSGQRGNEVTKSSLTEVRPVSGGRREANTWRASAPLQNEVASNNKNIYGARPSSRGREAVKKSSYILSASRENVWNNTGAKEVPYQHGGRQPWNDNMDNSRNRGAFTRDGYGIHQNRDNRPFFKSDKPHVEDPFMKDFSDSGFDAHDPFPVLGVAKKKKETFKQTEFHDPVRESFEAELELVQKMQEEEKRRVIEEQERVIELARTEEEERLRLAREQYERQRRLEDEAREAAFRNEQERVEAARRAEELRKSKEEEKHKLIMEEERRKQAAKQKLLELEEKISRRQAEAARGCSSSSTVSEDKYLDFVKEKETADVVDWEDSERMVDRITKSSAADLSVPTRSFESNGAPQFSKDGSFGFPDRQTPTWRKEDIESGDNSRFIPRNIENVPHSPQRDAGGGFPKEEFFGTTGYLNATSYFKPGFREHSLDLSWRTPGDGRPYGRNYGLESESRENFGEQYGDPGWGQSESHARRGPYPAYPEKLYQNPEGDDYYPFGRPRYSVRQPRVLPPPQESRQKSSFRSEADHHVPSTSGGGIKYSHTGGTNSSVLASHIGDPQDHHVILGSGMDEHHQFDSKLTARCDSQSSLSVTSPPDSPVHLSHDDLDESADSSVLAVFRKGEDTGLLEKGGLPTISSDVGKDSMMIATNSVSCWDNEEWTLDSNERLEEQEEYDENEDGYQDEDKIQGVDENIDLAHELEEMHLQDKDTNLVLGFNEGVEVEIPRDDIEKCQQNSEAACPLPQHSVNSLDGERPIETNCGKQAAQSVEISDPLSWQNASKSFQDTETTMQNLAIQPNIGPQSFEIANKVDPASYSTVSTDPVSPPPSIGLQPSALQTTIPPVPSTSAQIEEPVRFQFGLFSGPSLIPSPFPAIQIGSIQMPLPLHPHFGSSLTHVQPQSPIIQFGQLRYTSPISQGVLPSPPNSVFQANALPTYAFNQNPGSLATVQLGQGNSGNLVGKNAAVPVPNPQISVLRRPLNVSDGGRMKNANISPARASVEVAVSPQKQGELSSKTELPSRKVSHGKSNITERQSGCQVQTDTTAVRNFALRPTGTAEVSRADSGGYRRYRRQRVEFRVREPNWPSSEENRNGNGRAQNSTRGGSKKYAVSNKSQKQASDSSVSGFNPVQKTNTGGSYESRHGKDAVGKSPLIPNSGQANLKRNMISEKEIEAPLQSGIVRVFKQHGIEAPSDDDDFIEVRSKRQMLNDRREQREKEIKEKSQASKASRKPRSTLPNSIAVSRSNRSPPATRVANNKHFNLVSNRQPLAPIGTRSPKPDFHADESSGSRKSSQESTALPAIPRNDQNSASGFPFSNKNNVHDNIQTSVGTWGNQLTDQTVMALTQSQLDDAMKPVSLISCGSVGNSTNRISGPNPKLASVVPKNNSFRSGTSPIKSLLAEGKIQFGAVTSSTVIPPCGGCTENNSSLYFEKDNKQQNPSSAGMEICEAEAEAAASAIAVAAITNDETSGSGSVLPPVTKIYGGTELDDRAANGSVGGQPSLSKAEESLIVSLPADLSVDTPISPWPPLPSPHNSNQMITHFPPGPPHFPFYDVNPMLRGPIFAFGPHHDSGANQSQSQKGPGTVSGPPPTTWQQQGHSGVDSFYAPPAGFTGPFLTPPGAIPGVQGPPHMFVYNHFAPVGQFGGLSFMGTTYIPSGKQPDWKHNPIVSSSQAGGDGDANNPNMASMQCNIVPASLQHLPMPSPLAMFDPSPFQSSSSSQEMPVRARWPYMPFSGPPTMQIQKQQEAVDGSDLPSSQFNTSNMLPPPPNRYPNIQTSTVSADPVVDSSPPKSDLNSSNTQIPTSTGFKPPPPPQQQSSQENKTPSQNVGGGSSHHHQHHQHQHNRRSSFHSRNQPMARERGFPNNTKVKQIYVAKQTSSNSNNNASVSTSTTTSSPSI